MKELLILLMCLPIIFAGSKKYQKSFELKNGNEIELNTISGMDIEILTWDKDEVKIDLFVKISASSKEDEEDYFQNFIIEEDQFNNGSIITIEDDYHNGSSFSIFGIEFGSGSYNREIRGEIIIPNDSPLLTDLRYGLVKIKDMNGELILKGRSNELFIDNCLNLKEIENDYGNITILNSGGKLELDTRSSEVEIKTFNGPLTIKADYSELVIEDVTDFLHITSRSSDRTSISNIDGDIRINSPYSNIYVAECTGWTDIINRSGNIEAKNIKGFWIEAPYSDCIIESAKNLLDNKSKILSRSGKIDLKNIVSEIVIEDQYSDIDLFNITGNIELTSRSGSLYGNNIKGDWISKTEYSKINILNLESNILRMTNRSENIYINLIKVPSDLNIKNKYGGVELTVPSDFSGDYDFIANYGNIKSDFPLRIKEVSSSEVATGKLGNSKNTFVCETRSGDIKLISK